MSAIHSHTNINGKCFIIIIIMIIYYNISHHDHCLKNLSAFNLTSDVNGNTTNNRLNSSKLFTINKI